MCKKVGKVVLMGLGLGAALMGGAIAGTIGTMYLIKDKIGEDDFENLRGSLGFPKEEDYEEECNGDCSKCRVCETCEERDSCMTKPSGSDFESDKVGDDTVHPEAPNFPNYEEPGEFDEVPDKEDWLKLDLEEILALREAATKITGVLDKENKAHAKKTGHLDKNKTGFNSFGDIK